MSQQGWIGVDLDGTLAFYDHWRGAEHIGVPLMPMVQRVKQWLREGLDVRIFTARVWQGATHSDGTVNDQGAVQQAIAKWCQEHIGQVLPITNVKDYLMIELWDDRAVTRCSPTQEIHWPVSMRRKETP